jgi:hypothetical protein
MEGEHIRFQHSPFERQRKRIPRRPHHAAHPVTAHAKNAVPVVAETTPPDRTIGVQWARHDAPLEAKYLVGMLDRINTQR